MYLPKYFYISESNWKSRMKTSRGHRIAKAIGMQYELIRQLTRNRNMYLKMHSNVFTPANGGERSRAKVWTRWVKPALPSRRGIFNLPFSSFFSLRLYVENKIVLCVDVTMATILSCCLPTSAPWSSLDAKSLALFKVEKTIEIVIN